MARWFLYLGRLQGCVGGCVLCSLVAAALFFAEWFSPAARAFSWGPGSARVGSGAGEAWL